MKWGGRRGKEGRCAVGIFSYFRLFFLLQITRFLLVVAPAVNEPGHEFWNRVQVVGATFSNEYVQQQHNQQNNMSRCLCKRICLVDLVDL